ncbi:MAG: ABC transporter substrate-binding protein [Treponema sp.]|nr:ABC transporter substrate-binding protein [Treponema sp.]
MKKRLFALLLCLIVAASLFAGGGRQQAPTGPKVYRYTVTSDPPTLNAHNNTAVAIGDLYAWAHSGLYVRVPTPDRINSMLVPSIAGGEPIQINDWTWHIPIRRDAVWHNGDIINAHSFEYSYRMLLDPLLVNGMASFMFSGQIDVVNAREYFQQNQPGRTPVPWSDVGIRAINDHMLEIRTIQRWNAEDVKRHFLDRSLFPVYQPYYEAGMNASRTQTTYAATLDTFMGAGPFHYDTWMPQSLHIFEKNNDHWLSNLYHFTRVEVRVVGDMNARIQLFQNNEIDILSLDAISYELFRDDPRTRHSTSLQVVHMDFNSRNTNNPILANANFRRAIYYAVDRETIARIVGNMTPSNYYVNHEAAVTIDGQTVFYRDSPEGMANVLPNYGYDPARARQYFDTALREVGQTSVSVSLSYGEAIVAYRIAAEFLQQSLPALFGADRFTLTLRTIPPGGFDAAVNYTDNPTGHDMNFISWGSSGSRTRPHRAFEWNVSSYPEPDRPNPHTFAEFDRIFAEADTEAVRMNPRRHLQLTGDLERFYIENAIQVPFWQSRAFTLYSERLILPVDTFVPILGWGIHFADIRN